MNRRNCIFIIVIMLIVLASACIIPCLNKPAVVKQSIITKNIVDNDILEKGYPLGPFKIDYNDLSSIPWNIKDHYLRSYNADVQKLIFVGPLLAAYNNTKDIKYLIPAKNICLEWIKIHKKGNKNLSEFTWWEMIDGGRALIISNVFVKCMDRNLLSDVEKKIFIESLLEHTEYIMNDKNINFRNNHGFFQIACQLRFSKILIPYNSLFKKSYCQARKRLSKILAMQFFMKDGIHKENSPGYNYLCQGTLYQLYSEGHLTNYQKLLTNKLKQNIWWFTLPNSHVPNIGDTDYSMVAVNVDIPKSKNNYRVFKEAGYFIVKTAQSYLIQQAAFATATHKHCDDLNIYWFDLGQNILMDAGKYAYSGGHFPPKHPMSEQGFWYTNPNRIYVETTRAHNTLEFNEGDNPRKKKDFYKSAIKKSGYNKKDNYYYVVSKIDIRGKIFERTLYYSPEKYLVVQDKFYSTKEDLKIVKQWFHIAPDLTMQKDSEKYIINLKNNNRITVSQLNKDAKADRLYKGEKEPSMQGWISMDYDKIEPNYAFNYEIKNQNKGKFVTIFEINDNKVPESIRRKI